MNVELIDRMGTDLSVVNAARVSYAKTKEQFEDKDEKLIRRTSHRRQIANAVVIAIGRYFSRQQSLK